MAAEPPDLPVMPFATQAEWAAWLDENHDKARGVWLKMARKATGIPSVTHPEALEVALCYGWIDGQRNSFDEQYFIQRFTPRTARSKWSKINRDKVLALLEAGAMKPAGIKEMERAKADGRWDQAYDPPSKASVPDDLQQALDANPAAKAFFATLDRTNRYAIIYRVSDAKRPETRVRRIEQFVTMLAEGRKLYP